MKRPEPREAFFQQVPLALLAFLMTPAIVLYLLAAPYITLCCVADLASTDALTRALADPLNGVQCEAVDALARRAYRDRERVVEALTAHARGADRREVEAPEPLRSVLRLAVCFQLPQKGMGSEWKAEGVLRRLDADPHQTP